MKGAFSRVAQGDGLPVNGPGGISARQAAPFPGNIAATRKALALARGEVCTNGCMV